MDKTPSITVQCFHGSLKVSINTYDGGTMLFKTFVVTCANAMNNNVTIVRNLLFIVVENTAIGSLFPVAAVTKSPINPINNVTGRIAAV